MLGRFHKLHGLGNDFVVFDARDRAPIMSPARARALADRHRGVGCDQLIVLEASDVADATMRIWNPDGGEAQACGNAARCVALLLGRAATLATAGGTIEVSPDDAGARVAMGMPRFDWDALPLAYPLDTTALPLAWDDLARPAAVSIGNPHLVFFVEDVAAVDLARLGPVIEHDPLFPERINVNVAQVTGPSALSLRTWERGAGLTQACGTGACATAVAALRRHLVSAPVTVTLPGGVLVIDWRPGQPVTMTGPATYVFAGEVDWTRFPL